jgi:hypothetical protein
MLAKALALQLRARPRLVRAQEIAHDTLTTVAKSGGSAETTAAEAL